MEQFFNNPRTLMRLRQGLLTPYLNSFAKQLSEQGYAIVSGRTQIKLISAFGRWLRRNRVAAVSEITSEHGERYLRYRVKQHRLRRGDSAAVKSFLDLLRREGAIAQAVVTSSRTPAELYTEVFVNFLRKERGLASATITGYRWIIARFLTNYFSGSELDLSLLCAADIVGFVQQQAAVLHVKQAKLMTTALRSFLQFARYQGYVNIDLAAAVPTVAMWSMASIPRALPREQVELVLSSCNRQTAVGQRDYAILLLLARLGLRAGEIVSLALDDIDWQAGQITVHGKSARRPRLPLPHDVGEALAVYLRFGRPKTANKSVFVREKAP